jgi:quercetin dioxygenase-like cupin family protein
VGQVGQAIVVACCGVLACHRTPSASPAPVGVAAARPASTGGRVAGAPTPYALAPLDGSRLTVTVVEVRYEPGEKSRPHSHPCPVIGYIVEGAFRTQVKGEAEHVYTAGQTFYEAANGVHIVSANASDEKPVRFLAYFTCDHPTPLTVPSPDSGRSLRE